MAAMRRDSYPGVGPTAGGDLMPAPSSGLPPLPRSAWVEVDVDALLWNTLVLRRLAGPGCAIAAVVKADGYGHGLEMAALAAEAAGAAFSSVATLDEALALRGAGVANRVFVNYPVPAAGLAEAAAAGVEVVAGSDADVRALEALGPAAPAVHVEIDTGMARGGFEAAAAPLAAAALSGAGVRIAGAWSHLASPEDPAVVAAQAGRFGAAVAALRAVGAGPPPLHLCATGGLLGGAPRFDLARVGLALYGVRPGDLPAEDPLAALLRPALAVLARPVRLADVPLGAAVGYAGTWVAPRPSRLATLPLGYADGWTRGAAARTRVLVRGREVPVVGRISSDSLVVDVTGVPGAAADDVFVLLGSQGDAALPVEAVASARGTIPWEVLQTLSRRLPRVYRLGGEVVAVRRLDAGLAAVPDVAARLRAAARDAAAALDRAQGLHPPGR
jgi:alanine racemase